MTRYELWIASAILLSSTAAPMLHASAANEKTKITFSQPIEIPGKVLAAGTYTFKLLGDEGERNLVEIANASGTEVEATLITVPDKRIQATGKTVVKFEKRDPGSPEALKAWFYPGARYGQEFVYPKDKAQEIAKSNNESVIFLFSEQSLNPDQMRKSSVKAVKPTGDEIEILNFYKVPQNTDSWQ